MILLALRNSPKFCQQQSPNERPDPPLVDEGMIEWCASQELLEFHPPHVWSRLLAGMKETCPDVVGLSNINGVYTDSLIVLDIVFGDFADIVWPPLAAANP